MYHKIAEFSTAWKSMTDGTRKIMAALTDESLAQAVAKDHRTLGRMAWHITLTIPEMMEQTGLKIEGLKKDAPLPKTAAEIQKSYDMVAKALGEQVVKNWDDATLDKEDNLYGESWKRGLTLKI
ncbi:MAG: DinB family protein, partial [Candidatus Zixiibacteriota bacterium]